jgi:uncharacterized protein YfaS (alpha-2-macroglobulin family)
MSRGMCLMGQEDVMVIELSVKHVLILAVIAVAAVAAGYWYIESLRPAISVSVDKPEYQAGDVVSIRGTLTSGGSTMVGTDVGIEVKSPGSQTVWIDQVETGAGGEYISSFRLREDTPAGEYRVYVSTSVARGTTTFSVRTPLACSLDQDGTESSPQR